MSKLYIIREVYKPNKAETNRLLAYLHGLDEMGVKATVVFFIPDRQSSVVSDNFNNIDIVYFWKKLNITNRYLKHILEHIYVRLFIYSLKSGDRVFLSGFDFYVKNFTRRKDIKVFFETTEKPGLCNQFGLYSVLQNKLYFKSCKYLEGISVISTAIKEDFVAIGVAESKIHIINMTVDSSRFNDLAKQQGEKYIAYCGTVTNNKDGVDQLIRAFSLFSKQFPDYKLYIIGETPSQSMAFNNLELVKKLEVEDKVVFTGVIPANKTPQMLMNASILALDRPNNIQAKYGFPTKLGEYLLTRNPVVVTKVGDIPLFLRDGVSAMLAEPDSPEDFSLKLTWLVEHPIEADNIGTNGEKVALEFFNSRIETRKLAKMLNNY